MSNGIKSKERVKDYGEVFTPDSIVNDMLDLVDEQLYTYNNNNSFVPKNGINKHYKSDKLAYIDKTFLEPSCGDGQFLIRILYRKLKKIEEIGDITNTEKVVLLLKSLSTIYGVDIQPDNVAKAKDRMFKIATGETVTSFDLNNETRKIRVNLNIEFTERIIKAIHFILDTNIICGNTLTGYRYKVENGKAYPTEKLADCQDYELCLTEYKYIFAGMVMMKAYRLRPDGLDEKPKFEYDHIEYGNMINRKLLERELTEAEKRYIEQMKKYETNDDGELISF